MEQSLLQNLRLKYQPKLPPMLEKLERSMWMESPRQQSASNEVQQIFPDTCAFAPLRIELKPQTGKHGPLRVGVVLSGGRGNWRTQCDHRTV